MPILNQYQREERTSTDKIATSFIAFITEPSYGQRQRLSRAFRWDHPKEGKRSTYF